MWIRSLKLTLLVMALLIAIQAAETVSESADSLNLAAGQSPASTI